eukprot:scaffold14575_cov19-Tisochrysis_lutea.AAC.2
MIATLLMSLIARMPIAVAPAMGVNAYFTEAVAASLSLIAQAQYGSPTARESIREEKAQAC